MVARATGRSEHRGHRRSSMRELVGALACFLTTLISSHARCSWFSMRNHFSLIHMARIEKKETIHTRYNRSGLEIPARSEVCHALN